VGEGDGGEYNENERVHEDPQEQLIILVLYLLNILSFGDFKLIICRASVI
jgi:hypothetical protein